MAIGTGAAILGGTIAGGLLGAKASKSAASTQAAAATDAAALERQTAQEALALQREQFNAQQALQQRMYEEGVARQQPWLSAGQNALAQLQGQYNAMPAAFTGQVDLGQDPGYAFRLSEGQKALERSAAAKGNLLSGATGKNLLRFGQEMGSQEYQNAYSRALDKYNAAVQRESTGYNRLANMAGIGQTTASTLGAAGQTYAGQMGALGQNYANQAANISGQMAARVGEAGGAAAQARASGYLGTANALAGGFGNYMKYTQDQARNALLEKAILGRANLGVPSMSDFWDR